MLQGLLSFGGVSFKPDRDIPDLSGKVIIVTGANLKGLGTETALQLAKHNPARIYLAARSETKATDAIKEIQSKVPNAPISFLQCDLASLPSVQACAKEFNARESRLDLLFLNAGVMAIPAGTTEQGYEIQFGTNHLGHALLTKLLLPRLLKTAEEKDSDVRVISLASIGHSLAYSNGILLDEVKGDMSKHPTLRRYGQSKLANIYFAKGLNQKYGDKGITAVSLNPGIVNTNLYSNFYGSLGIFGKLNTMVQGLFYTSQANGALNQLWASVAKRGSGKGEVKAGEYYTPVGVAGQGTSLSGDQKQVDKLWEWTEKELEGYHA